MLCHRLYAVLLLLCCAVICVVLLLFVLFYVLIVCTVTLPPGVNPIAVEKNISYIIISPPLMGPMFPRPSLPRVLSYMGYSRRPLPRVSAFVSSTALIYQGLSSLQVVDTTIRC